MRKLLLLTGFMVAMCVSCHAQKQEQFKVTTKDRTAEDLLGLPAAYEVITCHIRLNTKVGVFAIGYSAKDIQDAEIKAGQTEDFYKNIDAHRFKALWNRMILQAMNGDKLSITDIIVRKGDREIKWAGKTIEVKK